MSITWKYVKPLEDNNLVRAYLADHHISIPEDMISIMEKYNGGRPSDKQIITSENREYVFKSLLSYNKNDLETIYDVYPEVFSNTSLYPIGSDAAGNFVCFDTSSKKYVFFNHETEKVETIKRMPF